MARCGGGIPAFSDDVFQDFVLNVFSTIVVVAVEEEDKGEWWLFAFMLVVEGDW